MGTKKEELESTTGCLAKAADDEPIFVLRAQDKLAPEIVRTWAHRVLMQRWDQSDGPIKFIAKLHEAQLLADRMEEWQREHSCKVPD